MSVHGKLVQNETQPGHNEGCIVFETHLKRKKIAQITPLGKFLRKIRIDNDEKESDMAGKLGFSCAFLSAVETGRKLPPKDLKEKIRATYEISPAQITEFEDAWFYTINHHRLSLAGFPEGDKALLLALAKNIQSLTFEEKEEIVQIMDI